MIWDAQLAYDHDRIVLPAYSVGAHHARFRWYCLAWKRGYKHTWNIPFREGFEWPKEPPVKDRMVKTRSKHDSERLGMLGNAIVPDAGRRAFIILVSGFRTGATSELVLTPPATCDMQRMSFFHSLLTHQTGASDASFQLAMGYATAKRAFSFQDFDRAHTFGPSHTAGF